MRFEYAVTAGNDKLNIVETEISEMKMIEGPVYEGESKCIVDLI